MQTKTSTKTKVGNSKFAKQMEKWKTKRSELEVRCTRMDLCVRERVCVYRKKSLRQRVCEHMCVYIRVYIYTHIMSM